MKNRNPIAVALLPFVTFGIYWLVATKKEVNERGAQIPTAWLIIIPFVNIWWLWKRSEGAGKITNEKMLAILTFISQLFLGSIGGAVIQNSFNQLDIAPAAVGSMPTTPSSPAPPVAPTAAPVPPSSIPPTPPQLPPHQSSN